MMPYKNREAEREQKRLYYLANREHIKAQVRSNRAKNINYYREFDRKRYPGRAAEQCASHKSWRANNLEQCKRKSKERHAQNRDRDLARSRRHYEANRKHYADLTKQWKQANPERRRQISNSWAKRNLEYMRSACHKRRAIAKGSAVGTDRAAYVAFVKHIRSIARISCYWCNTSVPKGKRQIDHIIPLARGGPDAVFNLCCSCGPCNHSKSAKRPEEFTGQYEIAFT